MTSALSPELAENLLGFPALEARVIRADNEADLVAAAKSGSLPSFDALVNRYERRIFRLAINITRNREDAEDVLQDAFLKCFQHFDEFRGDSRFYSWLVRIAVNEALMKLRKRRSDRSLPIEDAVDGEGETIPGEVMEWRPGPEQILAQAELRIILERAVQTLPAPQRAAFRLRDVEGLSTEETAELLNLTEAAVKSSLHRARAGLREQLSKTFMRGQIRLGGSPSWMRAGV
jgi:RNA polymerase sigma-70 factor, ECF subfamily